MSGGENYRMTQLRREYIILQQAVDAALLASEEHRHYVKDTGMAYNAHLKDECAACHMTALLKAAL